MLAPPRWPTVFPASRQRRYRRICASSDHVVVRNRDQRETEDAERTAKQRDVVGRIAFHNAMLQTEIRETPASSRYC